MKQCIVAIVGRPNVGKSALFNRITGKGHAIVHDFAGLTRDRNYGLAEWQGREFILVDTGGVDFETRDPLLKQVQEQTRLAMDEADAILWVVDGRTPLDRVDARLAGQLRRTSKPVLLVVNKIDNQEQEAQAQEFWSLGFGEPFPVSALHSRRVDDVLDALLARLPEAPVREAAAEDELLIKLAVVGQPNVGKSSLVNRLLGQDRVLVSEVPGTTRDSVDSDFRFQGRAYRIADTAGLRTPKHVSAAYERYAVVRALRSIKDCNVALLVLDASTPLTEQDERIAGFIHEAGRACVLVVNKWDLIEKDTHTSQEYIKILRRRLPFLDYAPIITLSAKTGQRVGRLLELAAYVDEQHVMRIKTSLLNRTLEEIVAKHPEPSRRGRALKINFISQTGVRPPAFALFVNEAKRMHFAYLRHIKNELRAKFGLEGTPVIVMLRGRKEAKGD